MRERLATYKSQDYFRAGDHYEKVGMLHLARRMRQIGDAMLERELNASIDKMREIRHVKS